MSVTVRNRATRLLATAVGIGSLLLVTSAAHATPAAENVGNQPARTVSANSEFTTNSIAVPRNSATDRCLDHSNSYGLRAIGCNGNDHQRWNVILVDNIGGNYEVRNVRTGRCLDDSDAYGLRAIGCNDSFHQQWTIRNQGNNQVSLKSRKTVECVDHSLSYGLRTIGCHYESWQLWKGFF